MSYLRIVVKIAGYKNKYVFLLLSITALLLFSSFFDQTKSIEIFFSVLISLVFLSGIYADIENYKIDTSELVLGGITLMLTWSGVIWDKNLFFRNITYFSYIIYFVFMTSRVIYRLINSERVDANIIMASIIGYLMIGLIGAIIATLLDQNLYNAFLLPHNIKELGFENFIYYSFVTLTTLGYGDILPNHPATRTLAFFLSASGQIYLTIIVGLLIGKYIRDEKK